MSQETSRVLVYGDDSMLGAQQVLSPALTTCKNRQPWRSSTCGDSAAMQQAVLPAEADLVFSIGAGLPLSRGDALVVFLLNASP